MPNFTPYQTAQFATFSPATLTAERLYAIAPAACAMNCRRAMELAVKWMYAVNKQLVFHYKKDLSVLLSTWNSWTWWMIKTSSGGWTFCAV